MSRGWLLLCAGALAGGSALAADIPGRWSVSAAVTPGFHALGSSSYGRGDVDYGWFRADRAVSAPAIPDPSDSPFDVAALFNGYLDLGTWYGLTPDIGAGAGASQIKVGGESSALAPSAVPRLPNTEWKVAWAMAGETTYGDVGHHYVNLANVGTGSDATGAMALTNLAAHEGRVGVRWSFDDLVR